MEWYYANLRGRVGPVNEEKFQALINKGEIKPTTLVWNASMTDWLKYGKVVGIVSDTGTDMQRTGSADTESYCSECGSAFAQENMIQFGNSWVCAECKSIFVQKLKEGVNLTGKMEYSGFWLRVGAKLIDVIIVGVVNTAMAFMLGYMMATSSDPSQALALTIILNIVNIATGAAYTTWFVGKFSATPGKMACGIKVVTAEGGNVSYLRAFGRHFAEMLSAIMLCIGYLMIAFDDEKRGLHDRICNTRVVKSQEAVRE